MDIIERVSELLSEINFLQKHQKTDGSLSAAGPYDFAREIESITRSAAYIYQYYDMHYMVQALEMDVNNWLCRGLNTKPYFDNSLKAFISPKNDQKLFLFSPMQTPNGPHDKKGFYFEAFLAKRNEPHILNAIKEQYPHPKDECISLKLSFASRGFSDNNCIVIFPENILTRDRIQNQSFAMFFYNKFYDIYHNETLSIAEDKIKNDFSRSRGLSREDTYTARSLWGYLHDLYHHKGHKPFHLNLYTKINFWVGILEEVKVDCQTILTLCSDDIEYSKEILEFIVFERILRYPAQHDHHKNFDSATGFFLVSWLYKDGNTLACSSDGKVQIDFGALLNSIGKLIIEIEMMEQIQDDEQFKTACTEFIQSYLDVSLSRKEVHVPESYKYLFKTYQDRNMGD